MNSIQSAGGPYVGLASDHLHLWQGIAGKDFVGLESPMPNDYEAAGTLVDGVAYKPCSIARLSGAVAEALIISMPVETALIAQDGRGVYLAQVHYANPDWSFEALHGADYAELQLDGSLEMDMPSGEFLLFDAAYPGNQAGRDSLSFYVRQGTYRFTSGLFRPNDSTLLTLIHITRL